MVPYWDTVEATKRAHDFFEIAGIVFLALLVFAEIATYKYGHRHDELVKEAADAQAREMASLRNRIEPRHLSADQKALMINKIRSAAWSKAEVIWVGSGEPESYARDLASVFDLAGVPVTVHTLGPFIPSAWGLLVVKTVNNDSSKLKAILEEAGVEADTALTNDTLGEKKWPTLVVGNRESHAGS